MRVLVLTNQFAPFSGSEIVALELARWFQAQGDTVTLAANFIAGPIAACAAGIYLTDAPEALELTDYDFIWCQHDMLAQLPLATLERAAARPKLPFVALVSLSPYEPYEHIDALLARALSADVVVNCAETRLEVERRAQVKINPSQMRIFHNAAPADFWADANTAPAGPLKAVLLISNHAPVEAIDTLTALNQAGIATRHIGVGRDWRLVRPADLAQADAIITIGKSAVYAIAQRKPVYLYDHFGGDGWLTRANFARNLEHNFSGRPLRRMLSAAEIANEIIDNYANAAAETLLLGEVMDVRRLSLDHHLAELRHSAALRAGAWRPSLQLRWYLMQPWFRAHLETSRAKSRVMKRSYLAKHGR